jgi:hypothetical protein
MCYHPSAEWLRAHDMNPAKAGAVEIANPRNFLKWTKEQPWMVLHEMAHAYHHRVLKHDHAGIKDAYARAKASGNYESVLHINGRKQRHYALNNDQEFFAEASEAFFGTNDFYPFVRAELKLHDPAAFELSVSQAYRWAKKNSPARITSQASNHTPAMIHRRCLTKKLRCS